jgi:HAD superfamily (subfamily IA) hydrolase, TIGR02254
MTYKNLFFDLDDTILDFKLAEDKALLHLFEDMKIPLTADIKEYYLTINKKAWSDYEKGRLSRQEVTEGRFETIFSYLGHEVDGREMDIKYRSYLAEDPKFLGQSLQVLEDLKNNYNLYLITNGVSVTQHKRLKAVDLVDFFEEIIISEEVGYQKPMPEIFQHAFSKVKHFDKKTSIMIGDSLSSDIKGGNHAGIDTVWLNNKGIENKTEIHPTYEIKKIEELYNIL